MQIQLSAVATGLRLDRWLRSQIPGLTQGKLQKLIRMGQIRLDGGRVRADTRIAEGQWVRMPSQLVELVSESPSWVAQPKTIEPDKIAALEAMILYRDSALLVLNKPPQLAVQGGTGTHHHLVAMLEGLRFEATEIPRLVHRLDRDTSGILVLARTRIAARILGKVFQERKACKLYWALTVGVPHPVCGELSLDLGKSRVKTEIEQNYRKSSRPVPRYHHSERMYPESKTSKPAITRWRVIDIAETLSESVQQQMTKPLAWLGLVPLTGRKHQLRAHCLALGTPILGDGKYAGRNAFLTPSIESQAVFPDSVKRLHLHARAIALPHPDGGVLKIVAPLPQHMASSFTCFGFDSQASEAQLEAFL